jgi:hypothetical protein
MAEKEKIDIASNFRHQNLEATRSWRLGTKKYLFIYLFPP